MRSSEILRSFRDPRGRIGSPECKRLGGGLCWGTRAIRPAFSLYPKEDIAAVDGKGKYGSDRRGTRKSKIIRVEGRSDFYSVASIFSIV